MNTYPKLGGSFLDGEIVRIYQRLTTGEVRVLIRKGDNSFERVTYIPGRSS